MNRINAFIFSVINRIFKLLGWHAVFINSSGVKCVNQSLSSDYLRSLKVKEEIVLDPAVLYLGFDGLKDTYTLLNRPIKSSPHFEFVEKLYSKKDYHQTDYFERFISGRLDLRYNQCPFLYDFDALYRAKKEFVETGEYLPILITEIDGTYYILDGKHTASLSLVLNKKLKCLLVDNPYNHPFYKLLLQKMEKKEKTFSKNIDFLKMAAAH